MTTRFRLNSMNNDKNEQLEAIQGMVLNLMTRIAELEARIDALENN